MDKLLVELTKRVNANQCIRDRFGFLHNLQEKSTEDLHLVAKFLTENYPHGFDESFEDELVQFRELLKQSIFKARERRELQIYRLITDNVLRETFPNASVALCMCLSLMITNCSENGRFQCSKE